mmetsp:Transcript_55671/g.180693  ORF Transcript_55671/g.180693 Transcript_55671/m.180693 type:complete len:202 (+) Transcript_55671:168-773(+)
MAVPNGPVSAGGNSCTAAGGTGTARARCLSGAARSPTLDNSWRMHRRCSSMSPSRSSSDWSRSRLLGEVPFKVPRSPLSGTLAGSGVARRGVPSRPERPKERRRIRLEAPTPPVRLRQDSPLNGSATSESKAPRGSKRVRSRAPAWAAGGRSSRSKRVPNSSNLRVSSSSCSRSARIEELSASASRPCSTCCSLCASRPWR